MKESREKYIFALKFLKDHSYFYDDSLRQSIFDCQKAKDKKNTLKNDKKICDEMIKNEKIIKKYLIKNDFDALKGFREFLHELNKSLVFKLATVYENCTLEEFRELEDEMETEEMVFNRKERIWLTKFIIKKYITDEGLEEISSLELGEAMEKIREIEDFKFDFWDFIYKL